MKQKKNLRWLLFVVVLLLAILFVMPFFLVILNSFKESSEFVANPFSFPSIVHVENYATALEKMNFAQAFLNSILICVIATVVSSVLSAMNAYVLTRYSSWKINKIVYMILVAAMLFPSR